MKKSFLAMAMATLMLTACGSNPGTTSSPSTSQQTSTSESISSAPSASSSVSSRSSSSSRDSSASTQSSKSDSTFSSASSTSSSASSASSVHVHTPGTPVEENVVPASCLEDGSYDLVTYCSTCNQELDRESKTTPALGHKAGTPVEENKVEPTDLTDGSYDLVTYCSVCEAEMVREYKTIPALGTLDKLSFELNDEEDGYWVKPINNSVSGPVVIPAFYEGLPVFSIEDYAFYDCKSVTSIVIPSTVVSIGPSAFYGCSSLASITLPFLGGSQHDNAFLGYLFGAREYSDNASYVPSSLKSVALLDGCTSIGDYAFYKCSSLTSVTIPDSVVSIGDGAFYDCSKLQYAQHDNGSYLGNANNPYLALISVISDMAITSCEIHSDCRLIGPEAFSISRFLTSVSIPNSISFIGVDAFKGAIRLQFAEYDNASYLGNADNPYLVLVSANGQDRSIKSCQIHPDCKFIGPEAFCANKFLTSISVPDGVTFIGELAFAGCSSLVSVSIPDGVAFIGNGAFRECLYLPSSIAIPGGVSTIGDYTFYNCQSFESVTISDGVSAIGDSAFSCCTSMATVSIPSSVVSIGKQAFYSCYALQTILYDGTEVEWDKVDKGSDWHLSVPEKAVVRCTDGDVPLDGSSFLN